MLFNLKQWINKRNGWIKANESLPKEGEHVLTYRNTYPTYKVDYIGNCPGGLEWMLSDSDEKVVYWKYITGPY